MFRGSSTRRGLELAIWQLAEIHLSLGHVTLCHVMLTLSLLGVRERLKGPLVPGVVSLPPCAAISLSPLLVPFLLRGLEQEMWLVSAALCQFGPAVQIAGV